MAFSKASSPQPSREWRGDAIYGSLWIFLANPGVDHEFGDQRVAAEITIQPLEARLSHQGGTLTQHNVLCWQSAAHLRSHACERSRHIASTDLQILRSTLAYMRRLRCHVQGRLVCVIAQGAGAPSPRNRCGSGKSCRFLGSCPRAGLPGGRDTAQA